MDPTRGLPVALIHCTRTFDAPKKKTPIAVIMQIKLARDEAREAREAREAADARWRTVDTDLEERDKEIVRLSKKNELLVTEVCLFVPDSFRRDHRKIRDCHHLYRHRCQLSRDHDHNDHHNPLHYG